MTGHALLIRQGSMTRPTDRLCLREVRRALRRVNRKLATAVLRDDANAYARASAEGARIAGRLRG